MCDKICKICGGDNEVAKIANYLGFRPDAAFARIKRLEQFIRNGVELGYIVVPEKDDPARKVIDDVFFEYYMDDLAKVLDKKPCSPTCQGHVTHPCEKCGQQWD